MATRQTMNQFCNRHGIRMTTEYADRNPYMANDDWTKSASHYKVIFRHKGKQMTTYFSQGCGISHDPTAESVLSCLALDAASVENARSFEEFARELGYNEDSRKAEKIYNICVKQAERLKRFLGDDLYRIALWETEQE